jgi:hypothetical protein
VPVRRAAACLTVLVLLSPAACGKDGAKDNKGAAGVTTTTASSAPDGGAGTTTTTPSGQPDKPGSGSSTTQTTTGGPQYATTTIPPDYRLDVSVRNNKSCVTPGETVTFKVTGAEPNTPVAWSMQYNDAQAHGNAGGGVANGKGEYEATFAVAPDVPTGPARLAVGGQKNGHNALGNFFFTVEKPGGC